MSAFITVSHSLRLRNISCEGDPLLCEIWCLYYLRSPRLVGSGCIYGFAINGMENWYSENEMEDRELSEHLYGKGIRKELKQRIEAARIQAGNISK